MAASDRPGLLNSAAARDLCDDEQDLVVQQLLESLLTVMQLSRHHGLEMSADVDALFVLEAARVVFKRKSFERIVSGEDLHWFPQDD